MLRYWYVKFGLFWTHHSCLELDTFTLSCFVLLVPMHWGMVRSSQ
jgi:hypothetical protein